MRRLLLVATVSVFLFAGAALAEGPAANVADLAWMTGSYHGETGQGTLEENWATPDGGSIASLVRATDGSKTTMIELIVIEEHEGSLVLNLQQWDPGYQPRPQGVTTMNLVESMPNMVKFENVAEGGIQTLSYTLEGDTFTINVNDAIEIPLMRR